MECFKTEQKTPELPLRDFRRLTWKCHHFSLSTGIIAYAILKSNILKNLL